MIDWSHKGGFIPVVHCAFKQHSFLESIDAIQEIDYEIYIPLNLRVGVCSNLSQLAARRSPLSKNYISVYFDKLWPVQTGSSQFGQIIAWHAFSITSSLDFDKGGYVIQIE